MIEYARVEPVFPGESIVCLGTGPSLCAEDVEYCRGRARVIAVKDAIKLAPFADVLYAAGSDRSLWWQHNGPTLVDFPGLRYTLDPDAAPWASVLRNTGMTGLETDPTGLRTGKNSGYQAIGIAFLLGASRIILLGFDLQPNAKGVDHFFGPRERIPPYASFVPLFDTIVQPLKDHGVEVINCSRVTALTCFPRQPLAVALGAPTLVAA